MANDISGNPWRLDTVGVITTSRVYVGNIMWLAGAGNLVILDNAGRDVLADTFASSTDHNYGALKWVTGLNLTVIGGGIVFLTPQNK